MAFRAKQFHEINKRKFAVKFEKKRRLWLSLANNQKLPINIRFAFYKKLRATRLSSFSKLSNRCLYTNRSYSVLRFFRMSRIMFRKYAREGLLVGVRRSSW